MEALLTANHFGQKRIPVVFCGPSIWNIIHNSILHLKFTTRNKIIAFADDLIILTRRECKMTTENYSNHDLMNFERWATLNKLEFNENIKIFCNKEKITSGINIT